MKILVAFLTISFSLFSIIFTSDVILDAFDFSVGKTALFLHEKNVNEVSWRIGFTTYLVSIPMNSKRLHIVGGAKFIVDDNEATLAEVYPLI